MITIEGVPALVTPHFAYFRLSGESSELSEEQFTVTFRGEIKRFNKSLRFLVLPTIVKPDRCEDIRLNDLNGGSKTRSPTVLTCIY